MKGWLSKGRPFELFLCLFLMWMFLCLLPLSVPISLSLPFSLSLTPPLSHFSVLDHQQRRRVKFSLPFPPAFSASALSTPRICFCTIHHVWSVSLLAVVHHGNTLLHTNLKFISQISGMVSEGLFIFLPFNNRKTLFVQEMSVQPGHILLHNLYLKWCEDKKTEMPNCLFDCV